MCPRRDTLVPAPRAPPSKHEPRRGHCRGPSPRRSHVCVPRGRCCACRSPLPCAGIGGTDMPGEVPPPSPIRGCKSRCKSSILGRSGGRVPHLAGGSQWGGRVGCRRCGTLAPSLRAPPVGGDAGGWRLPRPQGPRRRPGGPEPLGVSPRARPARAAAGASGGGCPGVGSGRPWLSRVQVGGVVGVHLVVGALVQSVDFPSRPGESVVRLRGARFPADWGSRPGPREAGVQLGASKRGRGAGRMPQPGSDVHAADYEPWLALGRSRSGGGGRAGVRACPSRCAGRGSR